MRGLSDLISLYAHRETPLSNTPGLPPGVRSGGGGGGGGGCLKSTVSQNSPAAARSLVEYPFPPYIFLIDHSSYGQDGLR